MQKIVSCPAGQYIDRVSLFVCMMTFYVSISTFHVTHCVVNFVICCYLFVVCAMPHEIKHCVVDVEWVG